MIKKQKNSLLDSLHALLIGRKADTQEALCAALEKMGYDVNQSKVSRLLRKVGAIKVVNTAGQTVYSLPREPAPPSIKTSLGDLITEIVCNETLVVIFTSPGSASIGLFLKQKKKLSKRSSFLECKNSAKLILQNYREDNNSV